MMKHSCIAGKDGKLFSRMLRATLFGFALSCWMQPAYSEAKSISPWRESDRVLVEFCFDGLDGTAPKTLKAVSVTDSSISTASINLIGLTLSNHPIYHGMVERPARFRSLLVQMPDTAVWAKLEAPKELDKHIDVWRDVSISQCTSDGQAEFKVLNGASLGEVECPSLGTHVSVKVASASEYSLEIYRTKDHGPQTYNGLRGCRDFVYGQKK